MRPPFGTYLAGPGGVRILWPDGTATYVAERVMVRFERRRPRRIIGTLYPLHTSGSLAYEAPQLEHVSRRHRAHD